MIAPIQYLRGIAAMLVVLFHAMNKAPGFEGFNSTASFVPNGVDLFFVISGFIMWVTTAERPIAPSEFIRRRLIRIVPLYWLTTLAMIALSVIPGMLASLQVTAGAIAESLLFIPYYSVSDPGHIWPVLQPGWTLNYEMFFYVLFALSLALSGRIRGLAIIGSLCILTSIGIMFGPFTGPVAQTYTSSLLLEFAAGIVVSQLWLRGVLRPGLPLSLVFLVAGFCLLGLRQNYLHTAGALLVVAGCLDPVISSVRSRLLLALGDASYSIYLTHMFTQGALGVIWRHVFPAPSLASGILFIGVSLITCPVAAWLCYQFVERPITTHLQQLTRPKRVVVLREA